MPIELNYNFGLNSIWAIRLKIVKVQTYATNTMTARKNLDYIGFTSIVHEDLLFVAYWFFET